MSIEEQRNWYADLSDTLAYIEVYAPNFPNETYYTPCEQPTLDSVFAEVKYLLNGLEAQIDKKPWMDDFLAEINRSYDVFKSHGRCRAAIIPIEKAEELLCQSKRRKMQSPQQKSARLSQDDNERSGGTTDEAPQSEEK